MKKFITTFFLLFLFFSNNYSHAAGGWLGIQMATLDQKTMEGFKLPQNTPKNVLIQGVMKNSAADLANLLPGDVILEMNNQTIKNIKNLLDTLDKFSAGDDINIKIFRENSEKIIKVKLGKRPSDQNFEFVEGSEKFIIFDLGITFEATRNLIYTKYFSKEILDKYQSDGWIVTCIDKGSFA
jgi:membrane-associated protease RseP (regulator of RpoE activity)